MAIIAAGTQPTVRCGMTGHQATLREALGADPADRRADPRQGGRRAGPPAPGRPGRRQGQGRSTVVVLTDGGFEDAAKLAEAGGRQGRRRRRQDGERRDHPVPGPPEPGRPDRLPDPGRGRQRLRRAGRDPAGDRPRRQARSTSSRSSSSPGERYRKVFEKTSADGGRLVARLDRADALPADNRAWAILPRREIQPVTLVSEGNLFLEKVFEANPLVNLTVAKDAPADARPRDHGLPQGGPGEAPARPGPGDRADRRRPTSGRSARSSRTRS